MKKAIKLTLILLISVTNLLAQKNDFWINVGFHVNLPDRLFNSDIPQYNPKNGGVGFHIMPKWNYSNHISYGFNLEYSAVFADSDFDVYNTLNILSVSPTFKYNITDAKVRPFAGIGVGLYHIFDHTPILNLGIKPLIGISIFDIFNLSFEYTKILFNVNENPNRYEGFNEYYVSVKGSFTIGIKKFNHPK